MKAKEYLQEYLGDARPINERLTDIVLKFVSEVKTIGEARHAKSDMSLVAIIKEQDQKWRAFARMLPDGKDGRLDGSFVESFKVVMPSVWQAVLVAEFRQRDRVRGRC